MATVLGRKIDLSDDRVVFFGQNADKPEKYYIGFRGDDGEELKFVLTREAKDALRILLTNPEAGLPLQEFPHKPVPDIWAWREKRDQ